MYRHNILAPAPAYLGEVLAPDKATAEIRGRDTYGGAVVVHAAIGAPNSALLERALKKVEARRRAPRARGHHFTRRKPMEGDV